MGPKERDDPGEGRRALGEKAFSSDPRGSLGVSDPPAAAPQRGGGGRVRRPRGVSKLWEIVKDREAKCAVVRGVEKS